MEQDVIRLRALEMALKFYEGRQVDLYEIFDLANEFKRYINGIE